MEKVDFRLFTQLISKSSQIYKTSFSAKKMLYFDSIAFFSTFKTPQKQDVNTSIYLFFTQLPETKYKQLFAGQHDLKSR